MVYGLILNNLLCASFLQISYPPSDEEDSDDSEGENQELAQIDRGKPIG